MNAGGHIKQANLAAGRVNDVAQRPDQHQFGVRAHRRGQHFHALRQRDIVGILAQHVFTVAQIETGVEQAGQAVRPRQAIDLDARVPLGVALRQFQAAVGGAMVQHQQAPVLECLLADAVDGFRQIIDTVLDGEQYVECRHRSSSCLV